MVQHTPAPSGGSSEELESRRATFYRSSEGKIRTDIFTGTTREQQRTPSTIEVIDPERGIADILDPRSLLDHRIVVQHAPFFMTGGCCPEKMMALQSAELSLLESAGLEIPNLGIGSRGDSLEVNPIGEMEGFDVEGYGGKLTLPKGTNGNDQDIVITIKKWYAPKIKAVLAIEVSDSRSGTTRVRLNDIKAEEPEQSLFTVPARYRVIGQKDLPRTK